MIAKKIAMKSFAEFVSGTEAARARILKGYKYPDEEAMAMAKYYWPAKSTIAEFHHKNHKQEWLLDKAVELEKSAMTPNKSLRTKLLNNARSIKSYAEYFGRLNYEVLGNVKLPFMLGGVTINATPDMHVSDGESEKYIKFNFSKNKLKYDYIKTMVACMSYGLHVNFQINNHDAVAFIDVPNGKIYQGLKITSTLVKEMKAQCEELETEWNSM